MQTSFWEQRSFLEGIDVAVIGSGIVGLTAAIHLKTRAPKLNVVVLERHFLPAGASTRNAGFACFGSISELLDDLTGEPSKVAALIEKRWRGLEKLRKRLGDQAIGWKSCSGFEVFLKGEEEHFERCEQHRALFNAMVKAFTGKKGAYRNREDLVHAMKLGKVKYLLENRLEGAVDSGKMMKSFLTMARELDIPIYNGFKVVSIEADGNDVHICSEEGRALKVRRALVANNGFARELLKGLDVQPARNIVMVTSPIEDLRVKGTFHHDRGYVYFRNVSGRIMIGGARNIDPVGEESGEMVVNPKIEQYLIDFLKTVVLPGKDFEIEYKWTGIMGLGKTKEPILTEVQPNIFTAVRLGGMGIAIGSQVGEEGAEMVLGSL